nr:hypothetical protein [Tanacetum cinerariifolium]
MDEGDDGDDDDDDGNSSRYDVDDEDEDNEDEEGEEEHLAPADSDVVISIDELISPPEGTEPTIPPPSTDTTTIGARITIRPQTSISLPPEAEVERLLAMPTPPPSPLTSLSPPSAGEHLARCMAPAALLSPPLPPSSYPPPLVDRKEAEVERLLAMPTLPPSPLTSLSPPSAGERLARYMAPAALLSPPLPPSSYPPPLVDRKDGILESEQPPRKRLCLGTLGSRKVGYGIRDTWIDPAEAVPDMVSTTLEKVNTRVAELAELHEHDTQDLYALLEDAQDGRTRISQRVAMDSQRVDLLMGDMMTLQETVWIVKEEAYAAREAWAQPLGLSQTIQHELQTLREQVYAQEYQLETHQA